MSDADALQPLARHRNHKNSDVTVLITGSNGFLGRTVVRHCRAQLKGARIVGCDLASSGSGDCNVYEAVDLVDCDVADLERIMLKHHIGSVIHVAGLVFLADDEGLSFNINVVATQKVVHAARVSGVEALVFTSSGGAVTSPFAKSDQTNTPCDFTPPPVRDGAAHPKARH
jgi:nucleoside-diphosphate-sugar epimerase